MYDLQFNGGRLKQLQEEMITVYSNLVNALKEAESEQEYLSGIWKGDAAEGFMKSQNIFFQRLGECAQQTEELLLSLEHAEESFLVIRTARSSRQDVIERITSVINLGGIAEVCLSSHVRDERHFVFSKQE